MESEFTQSVALEQMVWYFRRWVKGMEELSSKSTLNLGEVEYRKERIVNYANMWLESTALANPERPTVLAFRDKVEDNNYEAAFDCLTNLIVPTLLRYEQEIDNANGEIKDIEGRRAQLRERVTQVLGEYDQRLAAADEKTEKIEEVRADFRKRFDESYPTKQEEDAKLEDLDRLLFLEDRIKELERKSGVYLVTVDWLYPLKDSPVISQKEMGGAREITPE